MPLTEKQKRLPKALQDAILAKDKKPAKKPAKKPTMKPPVKKMPKANY